ncbi:hypothetical protein GCM10029964_050150 [Kibdelosporangium lantanae]
MRIAPLAVAALIAPLIATAVPGPAQARQPITWHDCRTGPDDDLGTQLAAVGARCGEVRVPLNHAAPDGRTITVALARRPATGQRRGTLLVNTGGPGPSMDGVTLLVHDSPAIAAAYDLVGVDPRFFGRSTPLECGWPTDEYLSVVQTASVDRVSFDRGVAAARDLASRCVGHRDVLPYASTRDVARDLDAVRSALGERRVSFLGLSYGTYLGAVYLQMFPDRVDRVVFDSSVDPDLHGPYLNRESAPPTRRRSPTGPGGQPSTMEAWATPRPRCWRTYAGQPTPGTRSRSVPTRWTEPCCPACCSRSTTPSPAMPN